MLRTLGQEFGTGARPYHTQDPLRKSPTISRCTGSRGGVWLLEERMAGLTWLIWVAMVAAQMAAPFHLETPHHLPFLSPSVCSREVVNLVTRGLRLRLHLIYLKPEHTISMTGATRYSTHQQLCVVLRVVHRIHTVFSIVHNITRTIVKAAPHSLIYLHFGIQDLFMRGLLCEFPGRDERCFSCFLRSTGGLRYVLRGEWSSHEESYNGYLPQHCSYP